MTVALGMPDKSEIVVGFKPADFSREAMASAISEIFSFFDLFIKLYDWLSAQTPTHKRFHNHQNISFPLTYKKFDNLENYSSIAYNFFLILFSKSFISKLLRLSFLFKFFPINCNNLE